MKHIGLQFFLALAFLIIFVQESAALSIDDLLGRTYLEVDPAFTYGLQYDDNIGWNENDQDRESDWSNRYMPAIVMRAIAPRFSLEASADLDIREYIDKKDYNYVDQNYSLTFGYLPNERWEYSLGVNYSVNMTTNRLEDTTDPTDPYALNRYKEKTMEFFGGATYVLSPRSTIGLTGSYAHYDSDVTNGSRFYSAVANYTYSLAPRTDFLINAGYFYYDFQGNNAADKADYDYWYSNYDYTMKNYTVSAGFNHEFLSGFKLNAMAGYRYTDTESREETGDPPPNDVVKTSGNGNGWTAQLELEKRYNDFLFNLGAYQDITISPTGANYDATSVRLQTTYDINRRCDAHVILRYYRAYADSSEKEFLNDRDTQSYTIQTFVGYQAYRWLKVTVGHQLRYTTNKDDNNNRYHRNIFYINFKFIPLRPLVLR